jgi:hypothetical protein
MPDERCSAGDSGRAPTSRCREYHSLLHFERNGRNLAGIAAAIIDSHLLLPPPPQPATPKRAPQKPSDLPEFAV